LPLKIILAILLALGLTTSSTIASSPDPTGNFTFPNISYVEGGSITFTVSRVTHVTKNDEVTLGIWCFAPDGSQLLIGNRNNPYIYEFNSFGGFVSPQVWSPPINGTGYDCTARLVAVDWFKGTPVRAWTLDEHQFSVGV